MTEEEFPELDRDVPSLNGLGLSVLRILFVLYPLIAHYLSWNAYAPAPLVFRRALIGRMAYDKIPKFSDFVASLPS